MICCILNRVTICFVFQAKSRLLRISYDSIPILADAILQLRDIKMTGGLSTSYLMTHLIELFEALRFSVLLKIRHSQSATDPPGRKPRSPEPAFTSTLEPEM